MSQFYSDAHLQTVTISDFTPGIYTFARTGYPIYSSNAPLGSAAVAFRCWAKPGVGLVPFPAYSLISTYTETGVGGLPFFLVCVNMRCLSQYFDDGLVTAYRSFAGTAGVVATQQAVTTITRQTVHTAPAQAPGAGTTVYTNTKLGSGSGGLGVVIGDLSNMDIGEFFNAGVAPSGYTRCVVTTDYTTSGSGVATVWVSVPDWASNADSASGTLSSNFAPRVFYQTNRLGVFEAPFWTTTAGFVAVAADLCSVSTTPLALQPFSSAGTFVPELGSIVGTWGCISTGELFGCYTTGGAFLVYGDLGGVGPTSVVKLPGVVGTGNALGPAALTTSGLVYATEDDGVYEWNGDNTATKISTQVPDSSFTRSPLPLSVSVTIGAHLNTCQVPWGQWVLFPHNWCYDTGTKAWWNCEDPAVIDFQVHAASVSQEFFFSAPGPVSNNTGAALSLNTYRWDKETLASSYVWISNPLPQTLGALTSMQVVEVVVSNPTATPATVTVTPTVPPGQTPFAQPNQTQQAVFIVPAFAVAARQAQRLGYTDYNIQIRVDASNTNPANPAPTLHTLTVGFAATRTSMIQ